VKTIKTRNYNEGNISPSMAVLSQLFHYSLHPSILITKEKVQIAKFVF
jgi:hypothetical protein